MAELHQSEGVLEYGPDIRALIWVDVSIGQYYRKLIPKYRDCKPQKYNPHITVVRIGREIPPNMEVWEKHKGEKIEFEYSPDIQFDGVYYYLNVFSERIAEIRMELGLPRYRFDDNKKYHITIGNAKVG